jgi:hypothetical protein
MNFLSLIKKYEKMPQQTSHFNVKNREFSSKVREKEKVCAWCFSST